MQADFKRIVSVLCEEPAASAREVTEDERTALIEEGKTLAFRTQEQRWRVMAAPFNQEEGVREDKLRELFGAWEQKAIAAGIDVERDRKSTRLNSSHLVISYAVFCLKKKKKKDKKKRNLKKNTKKYMCVMKI